METFNCPACGSEIATDGRALHKRSARLEDLEQTAALVPKLEQAVKDLRAEAQPPAPPKQKALPRRKAQAARPATTTKGEGKHGMVSQEGADPDDEFLR